MNRKAVAHLFPSSCWIKTCLRRGRHNHGSTTRQGDQLRSLDFHFKFIYDFKGRLNVESRAFFPLFLFRYVTLKYSCPKLGLKKKNLITMETLKNSLCFIGWQKQENSIICLLRCCWFQGVWVLFVFKNFFISLKGVVRFSRSDDGGGKRLVLHFSKMKDTIILLKGKTSWQAIHCSSQPTIWTVRK